MILDRVEGPLDRGIQQLDEGILASLAWLALLSLYTSALRLPVSTSCLPVTICQDLNNDEPVLAQVRLLASLLGASGSDSHSGPYSGDISKLDPHPTHPCNEVLVVSS